ncbi:MAG: hypothetical protein PVG19_00350 [Desulfobacterales bacterium]|mgnify:CR=1 FL=1|jgi:hypothetical protein
MAKLPNANMNYYTYDIKLLRSYVRKSPNALEARAIRFISAGAIDRADLMIGIGAMMPNDDGPNCPAGFGCTVLAAQVAFFDGPCDELVLKFKITGDFIYRPTQQAPCCRPVSVLRLFPPNTG